MPQCNMEPTHLRTNPKGTGRWSLYWERCSSVDFLEWYASNSHEEDRLVECQVTIMDSVWEWVNLVAEKRATRAMTNFSQIWDTNSGCRLPQSHQESWPSEAWEAGSLLRGDHELQTGAIFLTQAAKWIMNCMPSVHLYSLPEQHTPPSV